jgi:hypothetical protein
MLSIYMRCLLPWWQMPERLRHWPALTSRHSVRRRRWHWLARALLCRMRDGTAARKRARSPADSNHPDMPPCCSLTVRSCPAMRQGFPAVHRPQATRMSTGRSPGPAGKPGGVVHMEGALKASLPTA